MPPPPAGRSPGAGFAATARDYARFGQMVLDQGRAKGRQVVPAEWLAQAIAPAMGEGAEGGYGFQWWTVPNSDAFYPLGLEGQFIYIDPATRTVVVKLSYIPLEEESVHGRGADGDAGDCGMEPALMRQAGLASLAAILGELVCVQAGLAQEGPGIPPLERSIVQCNKARHADRHHR